MIPKTSRTIRSITPSPVIKSTVMFDGDYRKVMEETLEQIDLILENTLPQYGELFSVITSARTMKVRIANSEHGGECLITIRFDYNHRDEKYGYLHVSLSVGQFKKESLHYLVGKYGVRESANIGNDLVASIAKIVASI